MPRGRNTVTETDDGPDKAVRRRLQNRVNQRASRARKREKARSQRLEANNKTKETQVAISDAEEIPEEARVPSPAEELVVAQTAECSTPTPWVVIPSSADLSSAGESNEAVIPLSMEYAEPGHGLDSSYEGINNGSWDANIPGGPEQTLAGQDPYLVSPTALARWSPLDFDVETMQEWQLPEVEVGNDYLDLRALDIAIFDSFPAPADRQGKGTLPTSIGSGSSEQVRGLGVTVDDWMRWIARFDHSSLFGAALSHYSESELSMLESTALQGVDFLRAIRIHLV